MKELLARVFKEKQVDDGLSLKYKDVFNSKAGQEVMLDLLKFCQVAEPTYRPNDMTGTAFNEGMRRVGLRIISMVEGQPKKEKLDKDKETGYNIL